jgi:hypothetical protein
LIVCCQENADDPFCMRFCSVFIINTTSTATNLPPPLTTRRHSPLTATTHQHHSPLTTTTTTTTTNTTTGTGKCITGGGRFPDLHGKNADAGAGATPFVDRLWKAWVKNTAW